MATTNGINLYTDANHEYFFLIPNDVDIPVGDLEIYTLTGYLKTVDVSFLFPYQVSREQAQEWVSGQLMNLTTQIGKGLQGMWKSYREAGNPNLDKPKPRFSVDLLADLMGESVQDLHRDNEARKRGWELLFDDAAYVLAALQSRDPEQLAQVQVYLQGVGNLLRSHNINVDENVEARLQEWLSALGNQNENS